MRSQDSEAPPTESSLGFNLLLAGLIGLVAFILVGNALQEQPRRQTMQSEHSGE